MIRNDADPNPPPLFANDTLIRLANGCRRLAARGQTVSPLAQELNAQDLELIATILTNWPVQAASRTDDRAASNARLIVSGSVLLIRALMDRFGDPAMSRPTILERAFDLARHGPQSNLDGIRTQLKLEGFESVEAHLASRTLASQLRAICSHRSSAS